MEINECVRYEFVSYYLCMHTLIFGAVEHRKYWNLRVFIRKLEQPDALMTKSDICNRFCFCDCTNRFYRFFLLAVDAHFSQLFIRLSSCYWHFNNIDIILSGWKSVDFLNWRIKFLFFTPPTKCWVAYIGCTVLPCIRMQIFLRLSITTGYTRFYKLKELKGSLHIYTYSIHTQWRQRQYGRKRNFANSNVNAC